MPISICVDARQQHVIRFIAASIAAVNNGKMMNRKRGELPISICAHL
jgi:hypothetical protein